MKLNFNLNIALVLWMFLSGLMLNSCVKEDEVSVTEPSRYTREDVKSYGDLFKIFWTTMDQRYNYFYEQKRQDGKDWDAIYKEYYPKFAALKTFGRSTDTDQEIADDYKKAVQYFTEIINPILDMHFFLRVRLPLTNKGVGNTKTFFGRMKEKKANFYDFNSKYNFMKEKLGSDVIINESNDVTYMMGSLKSDPSIYYFTFDSFKLSDNVQIILEDEYLNTSVGNMLLLTPQEIEKNEELNAIKDVALRNKVKDFTINVLNQWNAFRSSNEVKAFNNQVAIFNNTEIISNEFVQITKTALNKSKNLVNYNNTSTYKSVLTDESRPYIDWFKLRMDQHVKYAYRMPAFETAVQEILDNAPFYQNFLTPLRKGEIKKLIIDLRDNSGGNVMDARFFTDRFVTKNTLFSYQRLKEGNGRFSYTPWTPVKTNPHKFGIPSNFPIVILTDKNSASMSEISTLMIKSQGNHAISIGDYSAGATAGLTSNSDEFNGGLRELVAGILTFNMPVMAMKDANGDVIEGIGVKPDIYVAPPTDEEVNQMKNSPATFKDRVLEEAVKYLSSK